MVVSCDEDQQRILGGSADRLTTPWGSPQLREFRSAKGGEEMTPESITRHMRKAAMETSDVLHGRGLPPDQALKVIANYRESCERLNKELGNKVFTPSCEEDASAILNGTADKGRAPWQ
jgi:hypothetical protein